MQLRLYSFVILLLFLLSSTIISAQVLSADDLRENSDGMPGEWVLQQVIDIGEGIEMVALIEETNKGNGVLSLGALSLKVVDQYGDGAVYAGAMPRLEFVDIDADGFK